LPGRAIVERANRLYDTIDLNNPESVVHRSIAARAGW
jgi:hypothetical protein